jgi:hypothetical protein
MAPPTNGDASAQDAWIKRVLGAAPVRIGANDDVRTAALAAWQTARAAAIDSLNNLADAVAAAALIDADLAVIRLRAIRANLTESPTEPQQIEALRRYLEEDDIIDAAETPNGYGVQIRLRDPLLDALDALEDA